MDIKELETKREELITLLSGGFSPRLKLFSITEFIEKLFGFDDKNIIESFLIEFFDEYLTLLKIFETTGLEPSKVDRIISAIGNLITLNLFKDYNNELLSVKELLIKDNNEIRNSLAGVPVKFEEHFYFPVTEYDIDKTEPRGYLEYIDVKISKNNKIKKDAFFIIPSTEKIEQRLNEQVKISWDVSIQFLKNRSLKIEGYHDVVISFNKKYGEYVGNSLGLVLTLSFIEELLRFYQVRDVIKIKAGIAVTGSMDKNGAAPALPDEIIYLKVKTVFFSSARFLIIPKGCENAAAKKLEILHKEYPERKLKIIEVESVFDLIDRRNLVDLNKINLGLYWGKKLNKRKYTFAFILLLFLLSGYLFLKDYDNNPYSLDVSNHHVAVKNKYGNILWQTAINTGYDGPLTKYDKDRIARIIDINKDGKNEVIITSEPYNILRDKKELGRIACFNFKHRLIWQYVFRDSIATRTEKFTPYYSLKILAINNDVPDPVLLAVGQHENFYPSPIIKLLLRNGKKTGKIFWHPGGGSRGFIRDIDGDGKDELVATSISNGLERCVLYSIEYNKLQGTAPTTPDYRFLHQPIADFDHYIVLPKSDVNKYFEERYNSPGTPPIITYDSLIYFNLVEESFPGGNNISIGYEFNRHFNLNEIIIGDKFRVIRDSLVAQGKIRGPYTETSEYKKYLRDQIKYWNGSEFVKIKDIK